MGRNQCLYALIVTVSFVSFLFAVEPAAANEMKGTKPDQHQTRDQRTTKQKLEQQEKGKGDAFKELNRHAPGGADAVPDVKGHNRSGGAGTGTGSGTGTTGASGGSGSGGSGSGGGGGN
jgi:hypothetical protein